LCVPLIGHLVKDIYISTISAPLLKYHKTLRNINSYQIVIVFLFIVLFLVLTNPEIRSKIENVGEQMFDIFQPSFQRGRCSPCAVKYMSMSSLSKIRTGG